MPTDAQRAYETVYILDPGISEGDATTIHEKIDSVIAKFQGKLNVRDDWGTRQMAYPINDRSTGKYCIINYTGIPGVVAEIERHFKILPNIVRYSTVLVDREYDYSKVRKQIKTGEEEYKKNREQRMKRN